jgi:hypothetical protein
MSPPCSDMKGIAWMLDYRVFPVVWVINIVISLSLSYHVPPGLYPMIPTKFPPIVEFHTLITYSDWLALLILISQANVWVTDIKSAVCTYPNS